jgi:hypothetical protein
LCLGSVLVRSESHDIQEGKLSRQTLGNWPGHPTEKLSRQSFRTLLSKPYYEGSVSPAPPKKLKPKDYAWNRTGKKNKDLKSPQILSSRIHTVIA